MTSRPTRTARSGSSVTAKRLLIQMKALKAEGVSMHKIAQRFGLPPRTVGRILQRTGQ